MPSYDNVRVSHSVPQHLPSYAGGQQRGKLNRPQASLRFKSAQEHRPSEKEVTSSKRVPPKSQDSNVPKSMATYVLPWLNIFRIGPMRLPCKLKRSHSPVFHQSREKLVLCLPLPPGNLEEVIIKINFNQV